MANSVVLEFIGDPTGLKPVADALDALGKLTKEQKAAFDKINADFASKTKQSFAPVEKSISDLTQKVKELPKAIAGGNFNEFAKGLKQGVNEGLKEFSAQIQKAAGESKTLVGQLRDLKNEMARLASEGLEGSKAFEDLQIKAAKLEDQIGDVRERVRVLASDTFHFDAAVDAIRGVAAAFTVAQSASALFGEENEDLQKALLKVQAATGLLAGVQELANQFTGQGSAKLAILSAAQKAYAFVTEGATLATRAFNAALLGVGAGAVIAGILAIAGAFSDTNEEIKEQGEILDDNTKKYEELKQAAQSFLQTIAPTISDVNVQLDKILPKITGGLTVFPKGLIVPPELKNEIKQLSEVSVNYFGHLKAGVSTYQDVIAAADKFRKAVTIQTEIQVTSDALDKLNVELEELKLASSTGGLSKEQSGRFFKIQPEITNTGTKLEKLKKQLIDLGGDPAVKKSLDTVEKEIGDIIKFSPNQKSVKEITDEFLNTLRKELTGRSEPLEMEVRLIPERNQKAFDDLANKLLQDDLDEIARKKEKEKIIRETTIQAAQETFDAIFSIAADARQRQLDDDLAALDVKKQRELDSLQKTEEAGILSHEAAEAKKQSIDAKFRAQEKALKSQAFQAEKQAKIAQAVINGALAITNVLANMQDPTITQTFKIAAIALNSIAVATQIATIAAQKPPAFRKGTKSAPGGWAVVGEEGPELVHLSQGSKVITHPETVKFLQGMNIPEIRAKYQLPALQRNFPIPQIDAEVSRMVVNGQNIDYDRIDKIFARHSKQSRVHVDKNGIVTIVDNDHNSRSYYNQKFDF